MTDQSIPTGHYTGPLPADFLPHLAHHLVDFDRELVRDGDVMVLRAGTAAIRVATGENHLVLAFHDTTPLQRHQLRELSLRLLDHICPEAAAGMVWTGFDPILGPPPTFQLARLMSRQRIGTNFLRLELACDRVPSLMGAGMHFSLLLPPEGRAPVWPWVTDEGRTSWPSGEDALHRAVYTFVSFDPAAGRLSFDIFLHPGSRTSDWATSAPLGSVIGIIGPGGGELPRGDQIVLAGDETALPAIRRILETSPPDRRCTVLIETADPADLVLGPMPTATDMRRIDRSAGETLWDALQDVTLPPPGESRFIWVAAEQDPVRKAKAHFLGLSQLLVTERYFSSYWVRPLG